MIELNRTPNADSRSAKSRISVMDLQRSTADHIDHVQKGLDYFIGLMKAAGKNHDHTKSDDIAHFHAAISSGDIKKSPWYRLHITKERHHLIAKAPDDVNLIDVLEHLVDCVMAGSARSGTIYDIDLSDELLQKAHKNTVELLKKQIKIMEVENGSEK